MVPVRLSDPDRIHSLDAFRTISIFFIITLHTHPFKGLTVIGNISNFVIDGFARFGVPLFFMISGYLFSMKISTNADPKSYFLRYFGKIMGIYLFAIVYFVFIVTYVESWLRAVAYTSSPVPTIMYLVNSWYNSVSNHVSEILFGNPIDLLYYGTLVNGKLWFLTSLAISIALVYNFENLGLESYMLPTATILHVWGMFGQTYYFVIGQPFPSRDALFFGFFYVSLGYFIQRSKYQFSGQNTQRYMWLFGVTALIHLFERWIIGYIALGNSINSEVYTTNYQVTTIFMVLSLFFLLLSDSQIGQDSIISRIGKYSVGIYIIHPGLIQIVEEVFNIVNYTVPTNLVGVLWGVTYTPALFIASLSLYYIFGRLGIIDYFYASEVG